MLDTLTPLAASLGLDVRVLALGGLLLGALLLLASFVSVARDQGAMRVRARLQAAGGSGAGATAAPSPFLPPEAVPRGIARAFLPAEQRERSQVRRDLQHAGFDNPDAVLWYYGLRVAVGLGLPALLAVMVLSREALPVVLADRLGQVPQSQLLMLFGGMILIGFYAPAMWVRSQAKARRERIALSFPTALDLLQVSIEAGLGFDAALARVAAEIGPAAPDIAKEFSLAQQEILAGRDREGAWQAMAGRLGIDEAHAFVNVVLQSLRFGTSMSQALLVYSGEMRQRRELAAQEKANRLPVQMSAVMALLMMPTLLIVTIGPVVLRYVHAFPE